MRVISHETPQRFAHAPGLPLPDIRVIRRPRGRAMDKLTTILASCNHHGKGMDFRGAFELFHRRFLLSPPSVLVSMLLTGCRHVLIVR